MLKKAGLVNGEMTAVVQSEERFRKYQEYVEANFKKASEGEETSEAEHFSSKEAEKFVKEHNESVTEKQDYDDAMYSTITVPVSKVMPDGDEVLCLELKEGLVKGIEISSMDEKTAKIAISDDATYSVVKLGGEVMEMTGADICKSVEGAARESLAKAAGRGR